MTTPTRPVKLIGMVTVCNEADILGEVLRHNAAYLDAVLVTDNGSTDGSAAIVEEIARQIPHIILVRQLPRLTAEQVRCHLYASFRREFGPQDWWLIVDADEFLPDDCRQVVSAAQRSSADHIFTWHANFYYKRSELEAWNRGGEEEHVADRARPIADRRRWYRMHTSMPRAFRNAPWIRWDCETSVPSNLAVPSPFPLRLRHYQYRDVTQILARIATRRTTAAPTEFFRDNPHWLKDSLESATSADDDSNLLLWDGVSELVVDAAMPAIPVRSRWVSRLKRARALLYALSHGQVNPKYFSAEDTNGLRLALCPQDTGVIVPVSPERRS